MSLLTSLNALVISFSADLPEPTDPRFEGGFGSLPEPVVPAAASRMAEMGAFGVVITLMVLAGIGIAIWRFSVTSKAAEELGLGGAGTFLALTDENATTAFMAGAAVQASSRNAGSAPIQDLASRLEGLRSALDKGLITAEEFAIKREQILHDA